MKLIRDIFTGVDGKTYDFGRVWGALLLSWFCAISTYSIVSSHGEHFDAVALGSGLAALIAGIGLHIMAKAGTEPPASGQ